MLRAYNVRYMARTTIKVHVFVDFVAKFTEGMADDKKRVTGVLMVSTSSIAN